MPSTRFAFSALILAQAAHSIEEYIGRLWESFPPARFLAGLFASDRELGFIALNAILVGFGLWCVLFPVRRSWASAPGFIRFWIVLETINGVVHPLWSLRQGEYTPGLLTAPVLLILAVYLALQLRNETRPTSEVGNS